VLQRTYSDLNSGYIANGIPRVVRITFDTLPNQTLVEKIRLDAQQTIAGYDIDADSVDVTFEEDQLHTLNIIITPK
jgi:hypothetical protein